MSLDQHVAEIPRSWAHTIGASAQRKGKATMSLSLHPQLRADCTVLGRFALCHVLLMNDANYPWFILVPDQDDVTEIYELSEIQQQQLVAESSLLARSLAIAFSAHKLNIAALGNVVSQLHVHHIVRYRHDPAWPKPVWGVQPAKPYNDTERAVTITRLRAVLPPAALRE